MSSIKRCPWSETHPLLTPYHDNEWGVVVHDERLLFEMLNLEGAQAGLSWLTVLKKRDRYRQVFDRFEAKKIIHYGAAKKKALLQDAGIIRNRLKVDAVIDNAKAFLAVKKEFGSFDRYLWGLVEGKPATRKTAPVLSERMSQELRKRGFRFVGATICYAFMQAVGMVNDHDPRCFRA